MTALITVSLTDMQKNGLDYLAVNPQEFLDNFAHEAARRSVNKIVQMYTTRALDEGVAIPASRELIVTDAFLRGWAKTAAAVTAEADAEATLENP